MSVRTVTGPLLFRAALNSAFMVGRIPRSARVPWTRTSLKAPRTARDRRSRPGARLRTRASASQLMPVSVCGKSKVYCAAACGRAAASAASAVRDSGAGRRCCFRGDDFGQR